MYQFSAPVLTSFVFSVRLSRDLPFLFETFFFFSLFLNFGSSYLDHVNVIWFADFIPLSLTFSQKKIKLSTSENLSVIPEVHEEENEGSIDHQLSLVKKDKKKSSKLSSELNRPSNLDKQKNDKSDCPSDETRSIFITLVICMTCQWCIFSFSDCSLHSA